MALPNFQTSDRILSMLQTQWSSQIDPVLAQPIVNGRVITGVSLVTGSNTINTLLSRKLQGWIIVSKSAASDIYDSQATNNMSDKTLILNSSAPCVVSILVF